MNKAVEINLLGKNYRVACPEGQEAALYNAANELAIRLDEARQKSTNNNEHLAMMVALNLSYELSSEKEKNSEYAKSMDERIRALQNTIEQALLENSSIKR